MSARRAGLALGLAVLAGATACGLHPPSDVRVDRRVVDDIGSEPDVRRLPPGPSSGESPEQVVRGFLGAASALDSDHALAREFLTSDVRWDDQAGASVYDPTTLSVRQLPPVRGQSSNQVRVRLRADRVATVDDDGAYLPARGSIDVTFPVERVGRDWRIAASPPGVLLTTRDLTRAYRPVQRYLLSAQGNVLVPDPVYLPGTRDSLPGTAVRALFAGPSSWLAPAVRSEVPPDLERLGSVVVDDGVAVVDLDRVAFDVPLDVRPLLVAQLGATLGTVPGVDMVRVLAEGRAYQERDPAGPAVVPQALRPRLDGPTLAVGPDGGLLQVQAPQPGEAPAGVIPTPGPSQDLLTAVADPNGSGTIAAIRSEGLGGQLLVGPLGGLREVPVPVGYMLGPTWLPGRGVLVLVPGPRLLLVTPQGRVSTLVGGILSILGQAQEMAVSPDGARIILRTGPLDPSRPGPGVASRLWLGRIAVRNGRPVPEGWVQIATGLDDAGHVSWSGSTQLVLTGRRGDTAPGLWRVDLGRLEDPVRVPTEGLPATPTAVSAAPGRSLFVVAGARLWRLDGERWTDLGPAKTVAQPH